jgi:hypothetical protein
VSGERPVISLPSRYSTRTALGSSAGLRGEKPVTLTTPFQLQVVVVTSHTASTEALRIFTMCMYVCIMYVCMYYVV